MPVQSGINRVYGLFLISEFITVTPTSKQPTRIGEEDDEETEQPKNTTITFTDSTKEYNMLGKGFLLLHEYI